MSEPEPTHAWITSPPLEVMMTIDEACESHASIDYARFAAQISELLSVVPKEFQGQLFAHLACQAMENDWLAHSQNDSTEPTCTSEPRLVEDYLRLAQPSWNQQEVLLFLVESELSARANANHPIPAIPLYIRRFPKHGPSIEFRIMQTLWETYPIVAQIESYSGHAIPISQRTIIGRQRSSEPPPIDVVWVSSETLRVIAAPTDYTTVSRDHLELKLETNGQIQLTPLTDRSPVTVNGSQLPYNHPKLVTIPVNSPVDIHVGPLHLALQSELGSKLADEAQQDDA